MDLFGALVEVAMSSVGVPFDAPQPRYRRRVPDARPIASTTAGALDIAGVLPASQLQRPAAPTVSSGIAALDTLTGGFPRGALSEIVGPASSGRSSLLLSLLAEMTRRQEVCALVDAGDSFDPESAAAAGVDLARLLWVRCAKSSPQRHRGTEKNSPPINADERASIRKSEIRNGKSKVTRWREGPICSVSAGLRGERNRGERNPVWARMEQALKATDLLLQGGGFGLVAVDLGDIASEAARRVPLTSWFRFRRAVENTPTVLLVVEQEASAKTCASLVLKLSAVSEPSAVSYQFGYSPMEAESVCPARGQANPIGDGTPAHAQILRGLRITAEVVRSRMSDNADSRTGKKLPRSATAQFASRAPWAG